MEDLVPILGVVVSIAALIANAASKKRKNTGKATENSPSAQGIPTQSLPEHWAERLERELKEAMGLPREEYTEKPEPESEPETEFELESETQPAFSSADSDQKRAQPAVTSAQQEGAATLIGSSMEAAVFETQFSDKSAAKATSGTEKSTAEAAIAAENDLQEDITDDFDLRKAVIYSEILKPKFEE